MRLLGVLVTSLVACSSAGRARDARPSPQDAAPAVTGSTPAVTGSTSSPVEAIAPDVVQASERVDDPPYDLAADQRRRARTAREELGAATVSTVVSDVFVVIGPSGWRGDSYRQSVALMQRAMAGFMNGRFGKKPSEAISVYLFPNGETYEAFCMQKYSAPCVARYGFYQSGDRSMVMNVGLGLGTLTHEIVHPLVEVDFPGAPTWINEGIASVFEQPRIPRLGEIHGGKNWRHPRLVRALSSGDRSKARLERLFGMSDEVFRGDDEDLHYAMARYVCQWLDTKGKLWPFYQRWRDGFADDPTGAKSFEAVVGSTPASAHSAWSRWTLAL